VFLLVFDDVNFSEEETFLLSECPLAFRVLLREAWTRQL